MHLMFHSVPRLQIYEVITLLLEEILPLSVYQMFASVFFKYWGYKDTFFSSEVIAYFGQISSGWIFWAFWDLLMQCKLLQELPYDSQGFLWYSLYSWYSCHRDVWIWSLFPNPSIGLTLTGYLIMYSLFVPFFPILILSLKFSRFSPCSYNWRVIPLTLSCWHLIGRLDNCFNKLLNRYK